MNHSHFSASRSDADPANKKDIQARFSIGLSQASDYPITKTQVPAVIA
jgi:hypothetical protein